MFSSSAVVRRSTGRTKRALAAVAAVLGVTVGGAVVTAPPASAATCNSGSTCYYWYNANGTSTLKRQEAGNLSGQLHPGNYGAWVWNHGVRYPGADHITLTTSLNGMRYRICLHYGAVNFALGSGVTTAARIAQGEIVTGWTWRGECAPGEDTWGRY
ncbi:hypothetical protein AB0L70_00530 [Kribbella sp. NPDC051952]|uniref:hypothetical protein n=1 Tax=Kribbella sp. NPDC051952 TaxID=3154851 RepID=UPI00341A3090